MFSRGLATDEGHVYLTDTWFVSPYDCSVGIPQQSTEKTVGQRSDGGVLTEFYGFRPAVLADSPDLCHDCSMPRGYVVVA